MSSVGNYCWRKFFSIKWSIILTDLESLPMRLSEVGCNDFLRSVVLKQIFAMQHWWRSKQTNACGGCIYEQQFAILWIYIPVDQRKITTVPVKYTQIIDCYECIFLLTVILLIFMIILLSSVLSIHYHVSHRDILLQPVCGNIFHKSCFPAPLESNSGHLN